MVIQATGYVTRVDVTSDMPRWESDGRSNRMSFGGRRVTLIVELDMTEKLDEYFFKGEGRVAITPYTPPKSLPARPMDKPATVADPW